MRQNSFLVKSLKFLWAIEMQHKFQSRLISRYPDFCAHTLHYTVCQFIIIEALLSPFEVKGLWGQTWPTNLLCPFSRYMSVRPVQYWSWIRSADLQSSKVVLKWLDECVFEQRFMVFENSHWKLIFSPKKLFIEILIGLTFLITSNYLKSALLYSDLVSVFGIALDFYIL